MLRALGGSEMRCYVRTVQREGLDPKEEMGPLRSTCLRLSRLLSRFLQLVLCSSEKSGVLFVPFIHHLCASASRIQDQGPSPTTVLQHHDAGVASFLPHTQVILAEYKVFSSHFISLNLLNRLFYFFSSMKCCYHKAITKQTNGSWYHFFFIPCK